MVKWQVVVKWSSGKWWSRWQVVKRQVVVKSSSGRVAETSERTRWHNLRLPRSLSSSTTRNLEKTKQSVPSRCWNACDEAKLADAHVHMHVHAHVYARCMHIHEARLADVHAQQVSREQ